MFNPEQFLDMQVTESNDTKVLPVPAGEYVAVVEKVGCRQWQSKKDPSMSGLTLDVLWSIDSPDLKASLGREKITVKQGIMLDVTDAGGLDMGKGRNAQLGRLREATNLNAAGQPFSFSMLSGRVAKINVTHRIEGEDIFADVKSVTRMA